MNLGTKKDKKVLVDPDLPVSTITTHPDEFIHYDRARNVSVREMARFSRSPMILPSADATRLTAPDDGLTSLAVPRSGMPCRPLLAQGLAYAIQAALGAAEAARVPVLTRVT